MKVVIGGLQRGGVQGSTLSMLCGRAIASLRGLDLQAIFDSVGKPKGQEYVMLALQIDETL